MGFSFVTKEPASIYYKDLKVGSIFKTLGSGNGRIYMKSEGGYVDLFSGGFLLDKEFGGTAVKEYMAKDLTVDLVEVLP